MKIFGSSGVRGVANEELTPTFVTRVAMAVGSVWTADADGPVRIALGRDTRTTGQMFADSASAGLTSVGCDVDRLGVIPTPGLQSYADSEGVPGVMITASHNPAQYNGVKLVGSDGVELARDALERVEDRLLGERFDHVPWDETGDTHRVDDARDRYVDALLGSVDRETIAEADLTVALDPGHGAGALTTPQVLRRLGCRVVTVNAQPDGHFPGRDPEPIEKNLGDLRRLVRTADADVGVAHDGDADRAIFVDETGAHVEGDAALAALAASELQPGDTTVSAVNVSQRLVDAVQAADASLELTPIGSTNIITSIQRLQREGQRVPIAGEGNGGVLFPDYHLARDGAYAAARFLELLVDRSASEVAAAHSGYHNVRVNVHYADDAERERLIRAAEETAHDADAELTTIDGYRLDYGDAWVLVRPSGTEPVVRIYAEAREAARAEELADSMYGALQDA